MATDQGPVVLSALLRTALIRHRRERELTQEQVAAALEWPQAKLIRIESGRHTITTADLSALLGLYGVSSDSERGRLHSLSQGAREPAWWDDYRAGLSPAYLNYVGFEAGASVIRIFNGAVIPGLLQTRGYAAEVTAAVVEDPATVGAAVELRLRRQSEMATRMPPPAQHYILDEAVIRRRAGARSEPAIMADQLRSIAGKARGDGQVTVQVMPFSAGTYAGFGGPFSLLGFGGGLPDVLYLEMGRDLIAMITGDDPRIGEYASAFQEMLGEALPAAESVDLILSAADEMS